MEMDPASADFGKILMEIPLPSDLVAHHIFSTGIAPRPTSLP